MNEKHHLLPKAKIEKSYFTWLLWLFPIAAAGLCAWFVLRDIVFAGPTVTIYFQNGDGLQEQNSSVKYRGVKIGEVKTLKLTKDHQQVEITAQLNPSAANVARQGSIFWIVRPELKLGSISGLRTIVSGNYITVQPGNGGRTNTFIGAENEPIQPIPALDVILLAPRLNSVQKQSPVFYRGIQVGEVIGFQLGDNADNVVIHARIREEYAPLVRANSKFWNAGGINFHLGLFSGAQISAESAQTLISGGLEFATPPDFGNAATNGAVFDLNDKEDPAWEKWSPVIPLHLAPEAATNKNKTSLSGLNSK